jgi:hypothetical protein
MALGLAGLFGGTASAAGQPVLHTKAAGLSAGSVKVAAQPTPHTKAAWQADIGHVRQPGRGCYHASYPALTWHAVKCVTAPRIPDALGLVSEPLKDARPETVGANTDQSAQVPGLISSATGTFQDVTPGITEAGQIDDAGSQVTNAFSLQLNSQRYINTNECGDSTEPANCRAAQQFIPL